MRKRKDIEKDGRLKQDLIIEVLLDIRETELKLLQLLKKGNKTKEK